jgi:hypothetical protein
MALGRGVVSGKSVERYVHVAWAQNINIEAQLHGACRHELPCAGPGERLVGMIAYRRC